MESGKPNIGDFGNEVAHLHERLALHGVEISAEERKRNFFGPSTREAIGEFQKARGIDPSCEVCDKTAALLSSTLAGEPIVSATPGLNPKRASKVELKVGDLTKIRPIQSPLNRDSKGADVVNLQEGLLLLLRRQILQVFEGEEGLLREQREQIYTDITQKLVAIFQERQQLNPGNNLGNVDESTAAAINKVLKELGAFDRKQPTANETLSLVRGEVRSLNRAGVNGLRVEIVDKNVGADVQLVSAKTDEQGMYQTGYRLADIQQRGKQTPDLQSRVFAGEIFLGASEVRYNASDNETLNVLLPETADAALASEHQTLINNLSAHFQGNLRDLQETDDRQDITYLANKTGWDARAVAIAALADQFSAKTQDANGTVQIEPAFFYTLFRAGLPANENALYQIDTRTAESIWKQGIQQGVIPTALEDQLPQALEHFQGLSVQRILDAPALVGVSSLKELLTISRIEDLQQQQQFVNLYTQHRGNMPNFWEAVERDFGEPVAKRLQVDGKLGYLTLNNAPLMQILHRDAGPSGITDTLNLLESGYYRAEKWQTLIADSGAIPPEIPGKTDVEKRNNYAELMSAQMRLSYPTAVVAQMVKNGETPLKNDLGDRVHALLMQHQGKFEIGLQPFEQYVVRNNLQHHPEVIQEIERIQRVYQITPSNEVMNLLLSKDLDSAYAVVRYDRDEFVQTFKEEMGGETNALLTYAKAQQVHNIVLNIATSYITARNAPGIGVHSAPKFINPTPSGSTSDAANAGDVIAYPTLENLFGEMDYCACEHCRSILSPAAYLVNLLQFCDRQKNEKENPQTVLLERRPDIQYLSLTCENTNIPLPYIDLVNETLEYFITHNLKLDNYTGHDTDSNATAEELLASPQFVSDKAYQTLAGQPMQVGDPLPLLPPTPPLPFHQPLENLRRYFDQFEAPLPSLMEALRKNDDMERANETEYGWRDILMEELRISRAEYRLLTDRSLTLQYLYGYSPAKPEDEILSNLANAREFTRRVRVSYEEIVEIIKTRFINPNSILIPKLERLGVPLATLKAFKDGAIADADFDKLVPAGIDTSLYGGDIKAWVRNDTNYTNIMGLITLTNPTAVADPCRFDRLEFRYANPDNTINRVRPFEFIRLIRFIRLWKKLGWTIEQTDKAISSLYPADQTPNSPDDTIDLQSLDAGFLTLLPRLGVIKQVMNSLNLKPTKDLLPLLACFAPIDTHGISLYRQMFLSPSLLKQDGVFADDGFGNFLINAAQPLTKHTEALRAALLLTDDEFHQITTVLGFDNNTPLTLATLSAIFRRGWLARILKLSVREFLLLTQFTGFDPFAAPDPSYSPIQRFIELVHHLSTLSLKPVQALYLIWNQDISGKSAPNDSEILGFAHELRAAVTAIENEYALIDDPDGQIARSRMVLVYGNTATNLFFGLLDNTFVSTVSYSHGQATLEVEIANAAPARIAYDDFRKQLSFTGVMTQAIVNGLKTIPGVSPQFQSAVGKLYDENQKILQPFFSRYPELLPLYNTYVASNDLIEKKRSDLLANFLPELKRRRKQQQVLQSIGAATKVEAGFASALLDNTTVLHAVDAPKDPALDDLIRLENIGLSAQFFFRDTATGAIDFTPPDPQANLSYSGTGRNPLPKNPAPNSAISGIWSGYLEAPENGFYNIAVEVDAGATVSLMLAGKEILSQDGNRWHNDKPIDLRAGTLYEIALKVEKVKEALTLRWQTIGRGWEVVPPTYLYPERSINNLRITYTRFLKMTALAIALKLTASETAYLAAHTDYQINGQGWLNSLPVNDSPGVATSIALRDAFIELLNFAQLKAELSPDDEKLLILLQDPIAAAQPQPKKHPTDSLLFHLTRWEASEVNALLTHFGLTIADLTHLQTFRRIFDAYVPIKALSIPASALLKSATNEPKAAIVRDLQSSLRARYNESDWLTVLKPINDEMRKLQRDALVAYILHQMSQNDKTKHIDTPNKLFEYFLMDVQMEPCMQTSRILHALSSVQLFIERCLMNLETSVSPSSIDTKKWKWMKHYRVWEANRKVFLYPENWLEPELRDDQSPFFKEAMSELLQGDITEDRAAVTLLNYLSKLEEVAKLEPCGIHYAENDLSKLEDDVAHVVARTAGANRKYFYRRCEYGYWTPWEQIKLDIEDNPVIPVVWQNRLFLFWLRLLKQAPLDGNTPKPEKPKPFTEFTTDDIKSNVPIMMYAALCWSEYYNGKWQPTKTSDINQPLLLKQINVAENSAFRSELSLSVREVNDTLQVYIGEMGRFIIYNTHSLPIPDKNILPPSVPKTSAPIRSPNTSSNTLTINYISRKFRNLWGEFLGAPDLPRSLLKNDLRDRVIEPKHFLNNPWKAPFFYEDSRHVFYVSTTSNPVTIREFIGHGIVAAPPQQVFNIPQMVFESKPRLRDKLDSVMEGQQFGVINPAPIERFVSEDAYIKKGIGSTGTLRYGDKELGPAGILSNQQIQQR